ncbi:transposase [Gluconacetobacter dulcium]|uniref:transposase n=1 Tax=Gluconacetobacter dulcium TaxID=2729096 RepID=UPI00287BBA03|nr:transposase [Gluconacetobacter dulcium]
MSAPHFRRTIGGFAAPYARQTSRLTDLHFDVACALGGSAGARMAMRLCCPVSADTLIRRIVRMAPITERHETPRVLGVDDWAWRRSHHYSTILVDLERNKVVDLLADRQGSILAAWLRDHPGIEIVARDRAGAYADGIRQGAPAAIQVADRWHLIRNLHDAFLTVVDRHTALARRIMADITNEVSPVEQPIDAEIVSNPGEAGPVASSHARHGERRAIPAGSRHAGEGTDDQPYRADNRCGTQDCPAVVATGSPFDMAASHLSARYHGSLCRLSRSTPDGRMSQCSSSASRNHGHGFLRPIWQRQGLDCIETVLGSCMSSCASQAHTHGQKSGTDAYDWIRQSVGKRRPVYPTPDDRCASACASHGLGKRHAGPFYQKITNTSGSSSRRRRENAFIPSCKWLAARPLCRSGRVAYPPGPSVPSKGRSAASR